MRFLQELHLAENKLIEIPHSIMRLKNLQILDMAHNKLVTISSAVGRLRGITNLNLASNVLEDIPKEIGEAQTLRKIDLSDNRIRLMPDETGNLYRLRKLNLNFNKLTKIPETFSQLSSLKMLLLCRNRIRELPKSLGAVVDVAAEYEKLANKLEVDKKKEEEKNLKVAFSTGGSTKFAEQFIQSEFEEWEKWAAIAKAAEVAAEKEEASSGGGGGGSDGEDSGKKRKKKKVPKVKGAALSPYMLLTGIVSSVVEEGTPVIQQQELWQDTGVEYGSEPDNTGPGSGSGAESEVEGGSHRVGAKYQYAKGIVCEIISASSVVIRVTTIGRKNVSSILFIPGNVLCTNYPPAQLNLSGGSSDEKIELGIPKTATQHQHVVLTFAPTKEDKEDDHEDEDGGYIGRFMRRLNRSAWLQQKDTGAVGKVLASLCLTLLPDLPDVLLLDAAKSAAESGVESGAESSKEDTTENNALSDIQLAKTKAEEEADLILTAEEKALEKSVLVTVVVLLLSKDASMFNTEDILTLYSDVPLPEIPDDESVDGQAATERHLVQPPTHVSSRVREMMISGPFNVAVENKYEEDLERGRILMQSSALEYAPPTVGILAMPPQCGPNVDNPRNDTVEVIQVGTTKQHKAEIRAAKKLQEAEKERDRRISVLIVTGRPIKKRNMYMCNEERPLIRSIDEAALGQPVRIEKQKVRLDPSRWAKLAGKVGALALMAGKHLKKNAIKLLEKAVGPERALEIEEKMAKSFDEAQAKALMLRQAAIERSIAMRHGFGPWAARMAKASADIRKTMRNRLIETVTGKFQLDDVSDDSDTPKTLDASTFGFGEADDAIQKTYASDFKGMLVGGIKVLSKEEVHDLMVQELEDYEKLMELEKLKEEKNKKLGLKSKKSKKKTNKEKKAAKKNAKTAMLVKPSLLANSLVVLRLSANKLTEVPETFSYFNRLENVSIDQNPILSPPSLLANMGISHIRAYFALRTLRMTQLKLEFNKREYLLKWGLSFGGIVLLENFVSLAWFVCVHELTFFFF